MTTEEQEEIEYSILSYLYSLKDNPDWITPDKLRNDLATSHGRHTINEVLDNLIRHKELIDEKTDKGNHYIHISYAGLTRYRKLVSDRDKKNLQLEVLESGIKTNNSVITTNENVRLTNNASIDLASRMNLFTAATALFAFCSVIVAIYQCKLSNNDRPIPELQQINTTLQDQIRELDSLRQTLKNANFVQRTIRDSLLKK